MASKRYQEIRDSLQQHSMENLERMAQVMTSPVIQRAITDEARERLTSQANAAYDAGAR